MQSFSLGEGVNISYRVGDHLMAVEDGRVCSTRSLARVPGRLVVEARIDWITPSKLHVSLPETQILVKGECIVLPRTCHKLERYVQLAPWEQENGEPGAPFEWKQQPFYPRVRGRWFAAPKAAYYNSEAWAAYSHHLEEQPEPPRDIVLEQCAQMLGIGCDADRREISAAFRSRVKQVHPDFGGTPDEFQKLLAARNTLLVKRSNL